MKLITDKCYPPNLLLYNVNKLTRSSRVTSKVDENVLMSRCLCGCFVWDNELLRCILCYLGYGKLSFG